VDAEDRGVQGQIWAVAPLDGWIHLVGLGETLGSHCKEIEDSCLLGCSTLMMEVVSPSERPVNFYQSTRRSDSDDNHLHLAGVLEWGICRFYVHRGSVL
jgi:hypothetical protein